MSSSNSSSTQQDSKSKSAKEATSAGLFGRKVWDKEIFEKKAKEREELEKAGVDTDAKRKAPIKHAVAPQERTALYARSKDEVDIDSVAGKKIKLDSVPGVQQGTISAAYAGAFVCKTCYMSFKDSNTYLDHLNSRYHVLAKGYTMRAVRASVDDVKSRLRKLEYTAPRKLAKAPATAAPSPAAAAIQNRLYYSSKPSYYPEASDSKKAKSSPAEEYKAPKEDDMMKALGFAAFGSSKK